ncbi:unnamed protein product [Chrysodeixis includens]|uniref:Uncharacterized protein n=1 Tax=Chrysodeixis includens TaxID=689277 RepID=A0A9N8KX67_CHRIL|nr:unnamed protein product [Chrysodeixis includens]
MRSHALSLAGLIPPYICVTAQVTRHGAIGTARPGRNYTPIPLGSTSVNTHNERLRRLDESECRVCRRTAGSPAAAARCWLPSAFPARGAQVPLMPPIRDDNPRRVASVTGIGTESNVKVMACTRRLRIEPNALQPQPRRPHSATLALCGRYNQHVCSILHSTLTYSMQPRSVKRTIIHIDSSITV